MSIKNNRKIIKKENLDSRLKSKLKENFDWMTEDETSLEDESLDGTDDLDGAPDMGGDDLGLEGGADDLDGGMGDDMSSGLADLDPSQEQQLDSEVDELLSFGLDDAMGDDMLAEDDMDDMDVEAPVDDINSDFGGDVPAEPVTDFIDTDELQAIINSPNSLEALENDLVSGITDGDGMEDDFSGDDDFESDDDFGLEENEDPFKGIKDLPGYSQGFEGDDMKDELMEDVDLASELAALDFTSESDPLGGTVKSSVNGKVRGGADSNVDTVNDGPQKAPGAKNIAPAGVMAESIKKSKMLVKAAAAILKLKQLQEAAVKEATKLKFENAKLSKVNALLAVAGDKMTKEVRTKIVESFQKCKTPKDVTALYGKIVNVIKESYKPSLNKTVSKVKTQVRTASKINESVDRTEDKTEATRQQMRKNYLMGMATSKDMYYDN
ncbi:MAG: hypothetical protein ABIP51_10070 [Bacteroidia bacterium]